MPFYPGLDLEKLGVDSVAELRRRPDLMVQIPEHTKVCLKYCGKPRTYSRSEAEEVLKQIEESNFDVTAELVGSYRRGKDELNDVDILVMGDDIMLPEKTKILMKGDRKIMCLILVGKNYIKTDITFSDEKSYPFALLHFTGSKVSNINLRKKAIKLGYKLNQYGLFTKTGRMVKGIKNERDIYEKLKKDYEKPTERNH